MKTGPAPDFALWLTAPDKREVLILQVSVHDLNTITRKLGKEVVHADVDGAADQSLAA
jgi:hypothetical protein